MVKKRERLEVIHDILTAIKNNNNDLKPTRLLYSSNLSPQMFKDNVVELLDKGFIEEIFNEKEKKSYALTNKGFKFLEEYKVIIGFIENFGL